MPQFIRFLIFQMTMSGKVVVFIANSKTYNRQRATTATLSVIFLNFNPTKDHEQASFRPAVVISNNVFNQNTKMVMVCPITSNDKYFPTHYNLEDTKNIHGAVLCEHIRSIDYESRNVKFVEKLSDNDFLSVITLLNACIEEQL